MSQRVVDLTDGVAMVVTDLHGQGDAYAAYRERFLTAYEAGEVQRLILCGDLIHGYGAAHADRSLEMILDVIDLQSSLGTDVVIMLLGNHELPHLYGMPLSRGNTDYTPRFEAMLAQAGSRVRERVLNFIDGLPFVVRTAAGVMINHAGAGALAALPGNRDRLMRFSHRSLLERVDRVLAAQDMAELRAAYSRSTGMDYDEAARYYLAVSGPDDPRYHDLLRSLALNHSDPEFELLWDTFFTRNEHAHGVETYARLLEAYLHTWSAGAPAPQVALVSGHIPVYGGHQIVAGRQLRLASRGHANPPDAGLYLLLDCGRPVESAEQLIASLRTVFHE
ncbi:MAG: hypothetical protein Kow0077_05180 [Anaerolineae bacterium]